MRVALLIANVLMLLWNIGVLVIFPFNYWTILSAVAIGMNATSILWILTS